jgi:hypothetical protein
MLRRIACGVLLCGMAALAGGCSGAVVPTVPTTGSITTETFNGTLNPTGSNIHPFLTITGGSVTMTLTTLGPDATQAIGFSLGTYNPTLNTCSVVFDNPAALQGFTFSAVASTTGTYCARMYDNGAVAAAVAASTDGSVTNFTYTITVTHP